MPNKKINECPFCGCMHPKLRRKSRTVIGGQTVRNTYVYCPICDARGARILYRDFESEEETEQRAINLWNRRNQNEL